MKHKIRYLLLGMILFSLCIPYLCFLLIDQQTLSMNKTWTGKQHDKELLENHEVAQALYTSFYGNESLKTSYDLTNISQYNEEHLSVLRPIIHSFETEINTFIKDGIIKKEYLKLSEEEPFTIPFGTLQISENETGTHHLDIIYSMENGYVEEATFTLDKKSNKIIGFTITNPNATSFTTKQKYTHLRKFISYLDLNDIEDWTQIEGSFSSYQLRAELCISEVHDDKTKSYTVSFMPIGRHENSQIIFR